MSQKSKSLLNASGKVVVSVRIVDNDGDHSIQEGYAWGENVKNQFSILFDHAVYNAVYKHYSKYGFRELQTDTYEIMDFTNEVTVNNYYIVYGNAVETWSVKRVNEDSHYKNYLFNEKGRIKSQTKYESPTKNKKRVNEYYNFPKRKKSKVKGKKIKKKKATKKQPKSKVKK